MRVGRFLSVFPRSMQGCLVCIIVFFIIESLIFNTVILYIVWKTSGVISEVVNAPGANMFDKLSSNKVFQEFVAVGKEGGFRSLLEHTVGRFYVEQIHDNSCHSVFSEPVSKLKAPSQTHTSPGLKPMVSRIGFDVSNAGEALFIMRRIQLLENGANSENSNSWSRLVIDIGANDGLMSSNSFNFIQWGWSALLVEPQNYQLDLARRNLYGMTNQHASQSVRFVQAVIGDQDGSALLLQSGDIMSMESHIIDKPGSSKNVVTVPSMRVSTLASKYKVPKYFGILSIDAEGSGDKILHTWLGLDYRPMYIIYEALHEVEPVRETVDKLEQAGYVFLDKRGWNFIFEYDRSLIVTASDNN